MPEQVPTVTVPEPTACIPSPKPFISGEQAWCMFSNVSVLFRKKTGNDEKFIFKAKENRHFKKIEALNLAAKNLATGNFAAFEEFTAFEDSDYDSSDCEEEPPSHGPGPQPVPLPGPLPVPQLPKAPPKSDKNHEVKPKEIFLK